MNKLKENINRRFLLTILNKNGATYREGSFDCKNNAPKQRAKNVKQLKNHIDNINNRYIAIDEIAVYTNMFISKY